MLTKTKMVTSVGLEVGDTVYKPGFLIAKLTSVIPFYDDWAAKGRVEIKWKDHGNVDRFSVLDATEEVPIKDEP